MTKDKRLIDIRNDIHSVGELMMRCEKVIDEIKKENAAPPIKATVTVTVWRSKSVTWYMDGIKWESDSYESLFYRGTYRFSGTPDVERVKRKTLDKGVLAVKIESIKGFDFWGHSKTKGVLVFDKCLGIGLCHAGEEYDYWYTNKKESPESYNDVDIEAAITKYLTESEEIK